MGTPLPHPSHHIKIVIVIVVFGSRLGRVSLREPTKAHFVEKVECTNGGKIRPFHCRLPVPTLNFQEFQERLNICVINRATNANNPREDMDCLPPVRIKAQRFQER